MDAVGSRRGNGEVGRLKQKMKMHLGMHPISRWTLKQGAETQAGSFEGYKTLLHWIALEVIQCSSPKSSTLGNPLDFLQKSFGHSSPGISRCPDGHPQPVTDGAQGGFEVHDSQLLPRACATQSQPSNVPLLAAVLPCPPTGVSNVAPVNY